MKMQRLLLLARLSATTLGRRRRTMEGPIQEGSYSILTRQIYDKARQTVEANIGNCNFSTKDFCQAMGMSRTVLFSKIKEVSGKTPGDFIIRVRLDNAATMLRRDLNLSIADIAEKTGFSSPGFFSKKFKDTYHIPPLSYRQHAIRRSG